MATALDTEVKTKHQALKSFTYGKKQTAKQGDVLNTSKWSGLSVGRMVRMGFLLEVPVSTTVKESDPYEEPKAEVKAEEPKEDADKEPDKTAKKGFFKKKKDA